MTYTKRTREEVQSEKQAYAGVIAARVKRLAQMTDAVAAGEAIQEYLHFMSRFHRYSAHNCVLIMAQKPTATYVAGYQKWKSMGRWPKKGSGIKVFAPSFRRVETQEEGEPSLHQLCGFHLTTVFDVSDTEGKELPAVSRFWVEDSQEGEWLYGALQSAAGRLGIHVQERNLGRAGGLSRGGAVEINAGNPTLAKASSLVHELAHELLHQQKRSEIDRQTEELEAEAVAYVVCSHFGLDVKAAEYIALWKGDSQQIMARLESIRRAATIIIQEVEKHEIEE